MEVYMNERNNTLLKSRELPKPTYDNSLIFSLSFHIPDSPSPELDYLKKQFSSGLYTPLVFTNFVPVSMDWHCDITKPDPGIQKFKNTVGSLVRNAKTFGVGLHIVLLYGDSRSVYLYNDAKIEDIRNAQWYSDNNLASKTRMENGVINEFVFTTFSRYARKLRKHMETKVSAVFKYLKTVQDQNPDLLFLISAPGEAELNSTRINQEKALQDYFCDFSPFAVLEFRDWIKHEGMYGSGGKYEGEGCQNGGYRFQGENGLKNFNHDFGTGFNTWNLKYYNWGLPDPVDTDYKDNVNPDPNIIPFSRYKFDGMMPQSGPYFTPGGFDPPRMMKPKGKDPFWDLFRDFREIMVHHYVKDMTSIARDSGFAKNHYFTHQIPGDYLWGTRPNDPNIDLTARYYASASPLWTADTFPDMGMGITMYDVNLITHYDRTSKYAVPDISSRSGNWGVLEYNPEVIFTNNIKDINTVDSIYQQIKRVYDANVHVISFFAWETGLKYRIKGTNREYAAKKFFDAVKDKARLPVNTVFIPTGINGFSGHYDNTGDFVKLTWRPEIWTGLKYQWTAWGDFKEFVIYRGYVENFQCDSNSEIARTAAFSYTDKNFLKAGKVYYKIAAVNVNGKNGSFASIGVKVGGTGLPVLIVSKDTLHFGASTAGAVSPPQDFTIANAGNNTMAWSVKPGANWITCSPAAGVDNGIIDVGVDASGKRAGTYTGTVTVSAAGAIGSPRVINVILQVYSRGKNKAPFGFFETPVNESTVSGSIPVTGWALDDIAVKSVKIYRKQGTRWEYVGDAVFIEGARPDVAAAYKTYPFNSKAGWGYMLLTHFLPNGGNGTYELKAVAKNITDRETLLGTKIIKCENAQVFKPFGTIDTPAQGGIASGSSYVNFGWALTPSPNMIPLDGSSIDVYIDRIKVGHPVYNNFRQDIASLFPGYANSKGAGGYFIFNTLNYANGLHTISWVVKDNAGNVDGIGTRYFTIWNQ